MEETLTIKDTTELAKFAKDLLKKLKPNKERITTIALSGDLGAGKTAFVQVLGQAIGIEEPITSPTFTILKSYEPTKGKWKQLFHMDAYRIDSEAELEPLQFFELLKTPKSLLCVEWAERIDNELRSPDAHLHFSINEDHSRTVRVIR